MIRPIILSVTLFILWLLMSGVYQPLIIGFGVISSVLCAGIVYRLGFFETPGILSELRLTRLLRYMGWLIVEIGKADWAVTKVILAPKLPKQQRFIDVPVNQRSDFAKAIFANSITLTPGTITVETEPDHFIVHALTDDAADLVELQKMGAKVSSLERVVN